MFLRRMNLAAAISFYCNVGQVHYYTKNSWVQEEIKRSICE